jgi:hypothetical protein
MNTRIASTKSRHDQRFGLFPRYHIEQAVERGLRIGLSFSEETPSLVLPLSLWIPSWLFALQILFHLYLFLLLVCILPFRHRWVLRNCWSLRGFVS